MGYLKLKRLTSTKTKNYLQYAFGEVFLVVMGILIALQVNNWNEKRKEKIDEKKILLSLHNEISSSLLNCNFVIRKKQDIISSAKEILSFTSPKGVWKSKYKLDSLIFHISNSGWRHVPQEGVLNELINSGKLSIVSDNILKTQISSLPKSIFSNDRK